MLVGVNGARIRLTNYLGKKALRRRQSGRKRTKTHRIDRLTSYCQYGVNASARESGRGMRGREYQWKIGDDPQQKKAIEDCRSRPQWRYQKRGEGSPGLRSILLLLAAI